MPPNMTFAQLERFRRRQMLELRKRVLQELMPAELYRVERRLWKRRKYQLRTRLYGAVPKQLTAVWAHTRSLRPDLHRQELMLWDSFMAERLEQLISQYDEWEDIDE